MTTALTTTGAMNYNSRKKNENNKEKRPDLKEEKGHSSNKNAYFHKPVGIDAQATGARIKKFIRQRGYSIKELNPQIGLAPDSNVIYSWMNGRKLPTLDNMKNLAEILDVPIDDIIITISRKKDDGDDTSA